MNYIEELEARLHEAKKATKPVITETIKHDRDEKVMVSSTGTTRTDYLGGKPVTYIPGHEPLAPALPPVLAPVTKEIGKVVKETDSERVVKLVSGTVRTERK